MSDRGRVVEHKVRAEYDAKAEVYPQFYRGHSQLAHFLKARLGHVRDLLSDCSGTRVLEVGCGPALLAGKLVSSGYAYYGVDISGKMVQQCNGRFGHLANAHFSVGTMRRLGFSDASFDVVLCLGVLEYVREKRAAVKEAARVLNRGGWLILSGNNKWSPRNWWGGWVARALGRSSQQTIVQAHHSEEEYRDLLSGHFSVQDVLYFDFSLLPDLVAERFPGVARVVRQRLDVLCRGALRRLGNGFVMTATKR